jgi:hypothetical protein
MALSLDGTTGISATGNIISSGGIISATGNIYGGNIIGTIAPSAITVSGNATVGNLLTGGLISATSTVTGGNILTGGVVSATGNINANFFIGNGSQLSGLSASKIFNGTSEANIGTSGGNANITIGGTSNVVVVATTGAYVTGLVSASGNVTGGNLLTGGLISATGNVAGNYFVGNGSALTGLSASKIFNGTSEANIGASGGNANITIGGTSNVFVVASTGIFTTGTSSISGNVTGGNLLTGGLISATSTITGTSHLGSVVSVTANVTGGNLLTGGLVSATGAIQVGGDMSLVGNIVDTGALWINTTANGNITLNANGTGVITFNNPITNGQANGVGNIGNSTGYFNRLFAQATTALYADLAEIYRADAQYPPGTVLVFGGTQEVTMSTESHDVKIAGVVSTHPAHVMNSGMTSEFTVEVGLIGRVPCQVIGPISAGDRVVASNRAGVAERLVMSKYQPGVIIGKAVESYSGTDVGTIEVVVGRL